MRRIIRIAAALMLLLVMTTGSMLEPSEAAPKRKVIDYNYAKTVALRDAGVNSRQVCKFHLEFDKKDKAYEITFYSRKNCARYSYDISRWGGVILERDIEYRYKKTCSRKKIGVRAAKWRVLKATKVKPAIINKASCVYRYKNREGTYQVRFRLGNRIYEYEILAPNGRIREIEYKYIGKL